jgi:Zn-dependent protease with chaperone function
MALHGNWFDGKTSASRSVSLDVDAEGLVIVTDSQHQLLLQVPFADIRVSSRVGNTPRYIYFPDGQKVETTDHHLIDQWLREHRPSLWQGIAHQLESHTYFVLLTLVLVAAFTYGTVRYGLPAAGRYIAFHLPASTMNRAATETLEFLDKTTLAPTTLDQQTQARLLSHFAPAIAQNPDLHLKVVFRQGQGIGANAFALPDGTMIFTDEIVYLSRNDNELLAVLAHEIGHVKYRHSLRAAIQGSVISFGVAMLTGDISAAGSLLAALPTLITTMSYSRDFEREADDNSLVFLDANNIPRHSFIDLMERLSYQGECRHLLGLDSLAKKWRSQTSSSASSMGLDASLSSEDSDEASGDDDDTKSAIEPDGNDNTDSAAKQARQARFLAEEYSEEWIQKHKGQCDKLMARKDNRFFEENIGGYFASHPATAERTAKFRAQPATAR